MLGGERVCCSQAIPLSMRGFVDGENGTEKLNLDISGAIVDNPCTRWSLACKFITFYYIFTSFIS